MATLLDKRYPASAMRVAGKENTFITDASGNAIGSAASDLRSAMATLLGISEADALKISVTDMTKRYVEAGYPTAP